MAKDVWAIVEQRDGKLKKVSFEVIGAGKKLAEKSGGKMVAVLLGSGVEGLAQDLAKYGADQVILADEALLKDYTCDGYTKVIAELAKEHQPDILLGGATSLGKDLMPRLAARLDTGMAQDCIDVGMNDQGLLVSKRPIYAGKAIVDVICPDARPQMASVRPNVLEVPAPEDGKSAEIVKSSVSLADGDIKAKLKEIVKGASDKVDLTEAAIIVSGGRAMKNQENFKILEDMADVLGATVGASRAAVDAGYAEHSMQVGQTGKVVNPNLYIACGISGAIQHLAGMRTSKVIVAVNKDPDAPIFQKADYGIVADLFKVVPLMTEEFKKLLAE